MVKAVTIFARSSILDIWLGSEYVSEIDCLNVGFLKTVAIYCEGKNWAISNNMKN